MIQIDGSFGEGGGQILRTSLSLSLITGKPFSIYNIRAGRRKPGLKNQHLTAIHAAAAIGDQGCQVSGNTKGSQELCFKPGMVSAGSYDFDTGTAGSAMLVFQTILPVLLVADGPSELTLSGGTHNPFAPTFDFIRQVFLPQIEKMGPRVSVSLEKHGFFPAGGGRFYAAITPVKKRKGFELMKRGKKLRLSAEAKISKLMDHVGERELNTAAESLEIPKKDRHLVRVTDSPGPGNVFSLKAEFEQVTELFTGFGEKGVPAEKVAQKTVREAEEYLNCEAAAGKHLADQLLLPLAITGGGRFSTTRPTPHTHTNIEVIRKFLDVGISVTQAQAGCFIIEIKP